MTPAAPQGGSEPQSRWRLLGRLESATIGMRSPDGSMAVRRGEPAGCFLYGPYLHLPQGRYRLTFRMPQRGAAHDARSRCSASRSSCSAGSSSNGAISPRPSSRRGRLARFRGIPEHSLESENEGRFEFRFFHLGNADLGVTAVDLERLAPDDACRSARPQLWRMLGRLNKSWLGRRTGDGGGAGSGASNRPACVLYGGWPYLRLPGGPLPADRARAQRTAAQAGRPVLGIEVLGAKPLAQPPLADAAGPPARDKRDANRRGAASPPRRLDAGPVAVDFAVPSRNGARGRAPTRRSTSGSTISAMPRSTSTRSI